MQGYKRWATDAVEAIHVKRRAKKRYLWLVSIKQQNILALSLLNSYKRIDLVLVDHVYEKNVNRGTARDGRQICHYIVAGDLIDIADIPAFLLFCILSSSGVLFIKGSMLF